MTWSVRLRCRTCGRRRRLRRGTAAASNDFSDGLDMDPEPERQNSRTLSASHRLPYGNNVIPRELGAGMPRPVDSAGPALLVTVPVVDGLVAQKQVVGVDARTVVAGMENISTGRNRTTVDFVGRSMGKSRRMGDRLETPVSRTVPIRGPLPAPMEWDRCDLVPKPLVHTALPKVWSPITTVSVQPCSGSAHLGGQDLAQTGALVVR